MLPTTCSTVVRRVLAWVAVCCAIWALLPASIACWSASLALLDASRIPSVARESVSLIILLLAAVSSSSSLTRSRMGAVCRCTYFLRAKGFRWPQKPRGYLAAEAVCRWRQRFAEPHSGQPGPPEQAENFGPAGNSGPAGWRRVDLAWSSRPAAQGPEARARRLRAALRICDSSFQLPPSWGSTGAPLQHA